MKLFLNRLFFTAGFILWTILASAQQRFYATISPAQINKDEYVTLRLVVENANDIQKIAPPVLPNFKLVSGPNQESGMSNVNGNVSQYIALSYILQPKSSGKFTINASTAVIGNKTVKSNPVSVVVKNETSGNSSPASQNTNPFSMMMPEENPNKIDIKDYVLHKGENLQDKVSKNMKLLMQTDKKSCYVGEPIVATYKLYTRLKSESKLSKNPSFNGFSVVDIPLPDGSNYSRETLNGRDYNVYTIRKAQLYGLQPGEVELESAELDNNIEFLKDEAGGNAQALLNGFRVSPDALVTQTVTLKSTPVMVTVKPLPEAGKPASFKGAVGNFNIEAALAKDKFTTDETGTFAIRISGSGNLNLVTAPDINWPDGIEAFEPKLTDNISNVTVPVSGEKVFSFSFAVQKEGSYTLPKIQFSYFDPQTGTYKKDSTKPISFTVSKGTGTPAYSHVDEAKKPEISMLNQIFHHRWWIVLFVGIVIFVGLYYWLRAETRKEKIAEQKIAEEKKALELAIEAAAISQKNPLEETQACLYREDCVEFYAVFNKEMKQFISDRFNLAIIQINSKSITTAMDKSGIENETVLQLQQLMQEIEWQLYTPFVQTEKRNELYDRASNLIAQLRIS